MADARIPRLLFLATLVAGVADVVHYFPLLPERVASHFGPSGMPNGWMTKAQFFAVYGLLLLPPLVLEFWVARRIAKQPDAKLNLPNKEYWLAPERRGATFAYFKTFFAWFGCAVLLLEIYVMGLAMRANLDAAPHLPARPVLSALALFLLFVFGAIIPTLRRFARPT